MSSYFDEQYGDDNEHDEKGDSEISDDDSSSNIIEETEDIEQDEIKDNEDDENEDEDNEDEDEDDDDDEDEKKKKIIPSKHIYKKHSDFVDDDDDNVENNDDDDDGEQYLQKFEQSVNDNYIVNFHPESILQNYDEILSMTKIVRNSDGIVIDKLHKTIPYLTKYEKARILGQRAKQINSGAYPFVKVPENVIDGYIIAEMELKQKRIPFIIRRPLPNGGSEYWKVQDLEDISF